MTQLNGLPNDVKAIDSKPMHNFGDSSSWVDNDGTPTPADSTFYMKPPDTEAWVVHSVRIRFSVNSDFTKPMIIKYYIHGNPAPVRTTTYTDTDDFLDRCNKFELLEVANNGKYGHNIFAFTYHFNEPLVLWGKLLSGEAFPPTVKMHYFTMEVQDHEELKNTEGTAVEMVKVRYPDIAVYDISEL